jgi:CheY-like chemotaxis protein
MLCKPRANRYVFGLIDRLAIPIIAVCFPSPQYCDTYMGVLDPTDLPAPGNERPVRLRVLIVEDLVDAAESLAKVLRHLGCDVLTAHDGATAVSRAITFQPQLVTIDLGLPGMSGYELARQLRSLPQFKGTYFAALSGHAGAVARQQALDDGCDCHIIKPASVPQLQQLLADVAARLER